MKKKNSQTKKTLLILWPLTFTEFDFYREEYIYLEKKFNFKIIIHDLLNVVYNKKINIIWRSKREKKAQRFYSLISWIIHFRKIRKKNILLYNHVDTDNFNAFIINLFIKLSNFPVLTYITSDAPVPKITKNTKYFLTKIKENIFKFHLYNYYIRRLFFNSLGKYIRFKKHFIMLTSNQKKGIPFIDSHSYDYSKYLIKNNKNTKKYKKNYIVYLDTPGPYFVGDDYFYQHKLNYSFSSEFKKSTNIKKWYLDLNAFFDNLEKFFNAKVVVLPHPKNKGIKNPYFNNRIVNHDYDAAFELIPNCKFIICKQSTGLAHAIINYKPVMFIYSAWYPFQLQYKEYMLLQASIIGMSPINICSYNKNKIVKNFNVNKNRYNSYKYTFLTSKNKENEKKANYEIIGDLMNKHI